MQFQSDSFRACLTSALAGNADALSQLQERYRAQLVAILRRQQRLQDRFTNAAASPEPDVLSWIRELLRHSTKETVVQGPRTVLNRGNSRLAAGSC